MLDTVTLRGRRLRPFDGAIVMRGSSARFGLAGPSQYVSQNADGTYDVDTGSIAAQLDSQSPSFGSALEAGLLNGLEVSAIATAAIGAVVIAEQAGLAAAAATVAAAAAGDAAAASALAAAGATAATGVGIVVAVVIALTVIYELGKATAGPGCCGTDTSQAYGTCNPSQFAWNAMQWQQTDNPPIVWVDNAGSAEEFLNGVVEQTFNSTTTCWSVAPPLGPILSRAVKAWNATHAPTVTRRITRTVNLVLPYTFGGQSSFSMQQPQSSEPIAVALNELSQNWTTDSSGNVVSTGSFLPVNATMAITVNDGALLSSLPNPQNKPPPATSASSSGGKALVVVGAGAAAGAGALYLYALRQGITMRQALRRLWK